MSRDFVIGMAVGALVMFMIMVLFVDTCSV